MLKVLELFGGIGAPRKALERLSIDFKTVDYVEIDKYAVKSYNAIYDENYVPQDICEWDKDINIDLIFHGSPCQDFSLAGKQRGGKEGSGTRSSLLWETIRIVQKVHPKYIIWENVKNVIGKKHKPIFDKYLEALENLGYTNYYKVLNTKDFGIPQNRQRIFTVSVKNKQILEFPKSFPLKLKLKDMLEDEVDEKFYLSDKMMKYIYPYDNENKGEGPKILIKNATKKGYIEAQIGDGIDLTYPDSKTRRGRVQKGKSNTITTSDNLGIIVKGNYSPSGHNASRIVDEKGIAPTVMENHGTVTAVVEKGIRALKNQEVSYCLDANYYKGTSVEQFEKKSRRQIIQESNLRIRKLTPKECWRLQGFDDQSFLKAEEVCSNSQLYKQAGNSITVNVLEHLFIKLFNLDKLEFLIQIYVTNKSINNRDICKAIIKEIKPYTSKERFLELIANYKNSENYKYLNEVT